MLFWYTLFPTYYYFDFPGGWTSGGCLKFHLRHDASDVFTSSAALFSILFIFVIWRWLESERSALLIGGVI